MPGGTGSTPPEPLGLSPAGSPPPGFCSLQGMGGMGSETFRRGAEGWLYRGFLYEKTFFGSSSLVGIFPGSQLEPVGNPGLEEGFTGPGAGGGSTCPGGLGGSPTRGLGVRFPGFGVGSRFQIPGHASRVFRNF